MKYITLRNTLKSRKNISNHSGNIMRVKYTKDNYIIIGITLYYETWRIFSVIGYNKLKVMVYKFNKNYAYSHNDWELVELAPDHIPGLQRMEYLRRKWEEKKSL